jgi:hypothetical protein
MNTLKIKQVITLLTFAAVLQMSVPAKAETHEECVAKCVKRYNEDLATCDKAATDQAGAAVLACGLSGPAYLECVAAALVAIKLSQTQCYDAAKVTKDRCVEDCPE